MSTVEQIKNNKKYSFDCYMTEDYKNETDIDEWGCASVWVGNVGVEYNFCIDNSTNEMINESAIYPMTFSGNGWTETHYNKFIHYEIDFSKQNWKDEFENAMCEALIKFFDL